MKKVALGLSLLVFSMAAGADQFSLVPEFKDRLADRVPLTVTSVHQEPVLRRGESGSWDAGDVLNPSVVKFKGKYFNYYSGYDGKIWRTGVATSDDGVSWEKYSGNPVLEPNASNWDQKYIAANGGAVVFKGKVYYAYHGVDAKGVTRIGLAVSTDGFSFKKNPKPVLSPTNDGGWESLAVADPYLIVHDGTLYLYYLGQNMALVQRIGVAKSSDSVNWVRSNANPIFDVGAQGAFDENGLGELSVAYQYPYFYMLYTGRAANEYRNVGYAVSLDGVQWRKISSEGLIGASKIGTWASKVICDTTLYPADGGKWNVWFGGGSVADPAQNIEGGIGMFTVDLSHGVDPYRFEAQAKAWNQVVHAEDFARGAYSVEGSGADSFVWSGPKVSMQLTSIHGDDSPGLVVRGASHVGTIAKVTGNPKPQVISIYVNGTRVESQSFTSDADFELKVPAQKIRELTSCCETFKLRIESSRYYVPAEYGISADGRKIAFMLRKAGYE